jgi:hypothetical protein
MMGLLLQAAVRLLSARDERGQGLSEYALLLIGILAAVAIALIALEIGLSDLINSIPPGN